MQQPLSPQVKVSSSLAAPASAFFAELEGRGHGYDMRTGSLNRAGCVMTLGQGIGGQTLYCGRVLGRLAIPGSNGQCGPSNGPQCSDCLAPHQESLSHGSFTQGLL